MVVSLSLDKRSFISHVSDHVSDHILDLKQIHMAIMSIARIVLEFSTADQTQQK